jgi:hypothetical protein
MNDPICMWTTVDIGTCLRVATDLTHFDMSLPRLRERRRLVIGDESDGLHLTLVKNDVEIEIVSEGECMGAATSPRLTPDPLEDPKAHIDLLIPLLKGAAIHSQTEPDLDKQAETDRIADLLHLIGGEIALMLKTPMIHMAAPSPWGAGVYRDGGVDHAIPQEWEAALKALVPPLYSIGAKGSGNATTSNSVAEVGRNWLMCHASSNPIESMRRLSREMREKGL